MNFSKFFLIFFSLVLTILTSITLFKLKDVDGWLKITLTIILVLTWISSSFVTYFTKYEGESEPKKESK